MDAPEPADRCPSLASAELGSGAPCASVAEISIASAFSESISAMVGPHLNVRIRARKVRRPARAP